MPLVDSAQATLAAYRQQLADAEKSPATVEKYLRDAKKFVAFAADNELSRELTFAYKEYLLRRKYAPRSVNSMLVALNRFLRFLGREDCRVSLLKCQRQIYCPESKKLNRTEYLRLLGAAEGRQRLHTLLQTICATGIRVSELRFFTVEAVAGGEVLVRCKGKSRTVLLPGKLKKLLLAYAKRRGIASGAIFVTRSGKPLDRSNIWAEMKSLCARAGVEPAKVFPHNLRKLFARMFYAADRDIARLADILGHRSIETTRIYIMTSSAEQQRKLDRLGLVI